MGVPWDEVPKHVARAVAGKKRFVLEGVRALSVLREGVRVDAVLWLDQPHPSVQLTPKQRSSNEGRRTNFRKHDLRGIEIVRASWT